MQQNEVEENENMYNPKSGKATEFIDDREILDSLEYAQKNKNNKEVIDNNDDSSVVNITKYDFSIDIIYDNSQNKEDLERKQAEEIKKLTESIARRKKLLSNSSYLNKAPSEIVVKEKKALEEELSQLESLK